MKRILWALVVVVLAISVAGCGQANNVLSVQAASGLTAKMVMVPTQPAPMKETSVRLTLKDENNQPLSGADVQLGLYKLNKSMPPYFLQTDYDGNGVYEAQVTFPIDGDWQVMVNVLTGGARQQFMYILHIN